VLPALSSQLSVFSKLCVMNTLLHFLLLLFQLCRCLRNMSLGGRILRKSKVIIMVGRVWWRHQRAPVFTLASPPPTLNPPLSAWTNGCINTRPSRACSAPTPTIDQFFTNRWNWWSPIDCAAGTKSNWDFHALMKLARILLNHAPIMKLENFCWRLRCRGEMPVA